MATPARKPSYADIEALPDNTTGEIIDGALYTQARPSGSHGIVASGLAGALDRPGAPGSEGTTTWIFCVEPELRHGDDVLVPDIAAWNAARLPPAARRASFFEIVPDWVCEIASPSTAMRDRRVKYGEATRQASSRRCAPRTR